MSDDPVFTSHVVHEHLEKGELSGSGQVQNAIGGRFHALLDKIAQVLGKSRQPGRGEDD